LKTAWITPLASGHLTLKAGSVIWSFPGSLTRTNGAYHPSFGTRQLKRLILRDERYHRVTIRKRVYPAATDRRGGAGERATSTVNVACKLFFSAFTWEEFEMNRIVLSTVAVLVAVVGFAMVGEDQQANAGLFGRKCCKPACCEPAAPVCCEPVCGGKKHCGGLFARLRAKKCCKPACCEPAPSCCEPAPTCCEPAPACGCEAECGCEAAPACGCEGAPAEAAPAPEAAPAAPEAPAAPAA
jgi:hypothetical protein